MAEAELDPSELGTHEYWKQSYIKEIINFDEHGDTGDVWFGEDSAIRVINWICECGVERNAAVIDLGKEYYLFETSRGAGARSGTVTATSCGFDPHSRKWNNNLNLYFNFYALSPPLNTQCLENSAACAEC